MKKTAVIYGATSGIGNEVALQLAEKGLHILGIGRNEAAASQLSSQLGDSFEFIQADLSLIAENQRVIQQVQERIQNIDLLVLSAGMFTDKSWLTAEGLEVNYTTHHLSRVMQAEALLPLLLKAPSPTIVYISSVGQYKKQNLDLQTIPYQVKTSLSTSLRSYSLNDYFFQSFKRQHPEINIIGFNPGPVSGTKLSKRPTTPIFLRLINPIFSIVGKDVKKVASGLITNALQKQKTVDVIYANHKKEIPTPVFLTEPAYADSIRKSSHMHLNSQVQDSPLKLSIKDVLKIGPNT